MTMECNESKKYAFLIMAHNEYEVLSALLTCLDDARNVIFLHIDKKVKDLPNIHLKRAKLVILSNRVDVRWGSISQIKCEYALFEKALEDGPFERYTLLSGVHMPLKSQDEIINYFEHYKDYDILAEVPNSEGQKILKMNRWNFFVNSYSSSKIVQRLWRIGIIIQDKFGITRNKRLKYAISSQWVSLTHDAVKELVAKKKEVLSEFRYSFCGDEWFVRSILERGKRQDKIFISDKLLYCTFDGAASPKALTMNDYDQLIASDCLFARKFSNTDMNIVQIIMDNVNAKS